MAQAYKDQSTGAVITIRESRGGIRWEIRSSQLHSSASFESVDTYPTPEAALKAAGVALGEMWEAMLHRRYGTDAPRGRKRRRNGYKIPRLTKTEYATLQWLADRGYDAGFLHAAGVEEEYDDGSALLGDIPEHEAWQISERYEEDPHAFLANSGSRSLNEKLYRFLDSIV